MPIRDGEKFLDNFIANTAEESKVLMEKFDRDIHVLAAKGHMLTGTDINDLKQEGLIGLARANRDFEQSRSEDFRIFAIYKIKDAMREFITKQASNVKIPQYIKDAIQLIESLKKVMGQVTDIRYLSYTGIWEFSEKTKTDQESVQKKIDDIRSSLTNLANRSHSAVTQLLERAEMMPKHAVDMSDYVLTETTNVFDEENKMVDLIYNRELIEDLYSILDESEISLLWKRFVEGITVRDLAPEMGIAPETIVVRTNNILDKVRCHRDRTLRNEANKTVKETNQGQPC